MEQEKNDRIDACVYFCYILDRFGELPEDSIKEIILIAAPEEYFEIVGSIGFMLEKELIGEKTDPDSGEKIFYLLHEGKQIAKDLSSHLSRSLRELTDREGKDILSQNFRERAIRCDIIRDREKDRYDLNVRFINEMNGDTILDLTLYAPDEEKAKEMRERFLSKPSFIITRILNMFLKDDFFMFDK